MKEVRVNGQIIRLNNVKDNAPLTPEMVRRAVSVCYGNTGVNANVSDGRIGYRVTPGNIRRMNATEEFDIFGI